MLGRVEALSPRSTVGAVEVPIALTRPLDPEEVYRHFVPAVLGYVRAQAAEDAEDVVSEIFLQVIRDLDRFRGDDAALRRWVFTIAHHRLVDDHRRRRRRPATVVWDGADERCRATSADDHVDDAPLIAALERLTRSQRDVVVLRFIADLPVADVARMLRRRQGAVKALQHRALSNLAELLAESDPSPVEFPDASSSPADSSEER